MGRVVGGGGVYILIVNFKNNNFGWKLRRDFFLLKYEFVVRGKIDLGWWN